MLGSRTSQTSKGINQDALVKKYGIVVRDIEEFTPKQTPVVVKKRKTKKRLTIGEGKDGIDRINTWEFMKTVFTPEEQAAYDYLMD